MLALVEVFWHVTAIEVPKVVKGHLDELIKEMYVMDGTSASIHGPIPVWVELKHLSV